jgi:hypothetical protein
MNNETGTVAAQMSVICAQPWGPPVDNRRIPGDFAPDRGTTLGIAKTLLTWGFASVSVCLVGSNDR